MPRCKSCGDPFDWDEAASAFNSHFDGEYDYDFNGWEGFCADCAISGQEDCDDDYDDNNPPPGCNACGGPYPSCKSACPIFDD